MTNQISKTTFLKYLRCPRAAAFEGDAAAIVRDYQRNLAHVGGEEKAKILEEETKEKLRQLFIRLIENDEGGAESEAEIESGDFDGLLKDDLTLKAMQEYAEEYHRAELLKLNKSDVIGSVCNHSWFPTTKDYKRAWRCTECKKVVHDKHLR